ncbi:MAG: CopD family protein [Gemmatimonadaceae bacterium]|nr:CopD family protein [Gemmatimonadaceae bacterium]
MPTGYWVSLTIHVLAALLWLGGAFFLGVVGAPVLRRIEPPALRQRLFHDLGLRFRSVGWGAIAVLVVSGVFNLHYRGLLRWDGVLGDPAFWATPMGHALGGKLLCVVVMLGISAVHDFAIGPAAGRSEPGSADALRARRRAALLGRINAVFGLALVIAAVRLARGG